MWQPIETAPKDGTEVDLWLRSDEGRGWRQTNAYWVTSLRDLSMPPCNQFVRDGWYCSSSNIDGFCEDNWLKATHWMPLPLDPE